MRTILEAGFVFWGLFVVFALVVGAYLVWMIWVESRSELEAPVEPDSSEETRGRGPK